MSVGGRHGSGDCAPFRRECHFLPSPFLLRSCPFCLSPAPLLWLSLFSSLFVCLRLLPSLPFSVETDAPSPKAPATVPAPGPAPAPCIVQHAGMGRQRCNQSSMDDGRWKALSAVWALHSQNSAQQPWNPGTLGRRQGCNLTSSIASASGGLPDCHLPGLSLLSSLLVLLLPSSSLLLLLSLSLLLCLAASSHLSELFHRRGSDDSPRPRPFTVNQTPCG